MSRSAPKNGPVFVSLLAITAWWGCAKASGDPTTQASSTSSSVSSGSSGGGGGGVGGAGADGGSDADAGPCVPTTAAAHHFQLDMLFVVDKSSRMQGATWTSVSVALPAFFAAPESAGVGVGMVMFPYSAGDCDLDHYKALTVPIGPVPANVTALTNAFPATPVGVGAPIYPALQGALLQATAHQDAHPTDTVAVVLVTNGDPTSCDTNLDDAATLAAGALDYNGVHTYVVALPNGSVADLSKIAVAGGTTAAVNATININQLPADLAQIRTTALGCDFAIPTPPNGKPLDPDAVNFSYTPKGVGKPVILLRANDPAGCSGQPGWYYDSNTAPTKIVLCPESCATVQADGNAEENVLFGCDSLLQ